MNDSHLLNSQRNAVFQAITAIGLSPAEFQWTWRAGESFGALTYQVPVLVHLPTESWFAFAETHRGHGVRYSPGENSREEGKEGLNWEGVLAYVELWLYALRRELQQEDLWQAVTEQRSLVVGRDAIEENTPFNSAERDRIAESLHAIAAEIARTRELSDRQTHILLDRMDELEAASGRMGRKDWLVFAVGTFTSIAISAGFAPDQTKNLFRLASAALQWLLGGHALLPH